MSNISAKEVNELRKATGAGMMDCKKALEESGGDFDKAIELLRIKGQKVSASRQDRDAKEGIVFAKVNSENNIGIMFEMNCETDFVALNSDFLALGNTIVEHALNAKIADLDSLNQLVIDGRPVSDHILDIVGKIREKIEISRYAILKAERVTLYIHQGAKIGVLVGFNNIGSTDMAVVGNDVAMQICAMKPLFISEDDVDQATKTREMDVAIGQVKEEGKPENMWEKIAEGKVKRFFKENCLLEQENIKDASQSIGKYLADKNKELKVTEFKRFGINDK